MSRIRIIMLSMLAVFAISAIASASASAAPTCYKVATAGTGTYENNECKTAGGAKEWVKIEKLETESAAGEPGEPATWCAKVAVGEPSKYKNNTCTEEKVGTGEYLKVMTAKRVWEVCEEVAGEGKEPPKKYDEHKCNTQEKELKLRKWQWKKLEAGESRNVISWIVPGTTYVLTVGARVITCTGAADAGTITGGKPGTDNISVLYYGCTTSQAGCLVRTAHQANGIILVPNIETKLVERATAKGVTVLADEFKEKATLKEFVTLKFEPEAGKSCSEFGTETKVKGQVAGEVINLANGNTEIKFPSPELKENTLEAFGAAAKLAGRSEVELENGWAFRAS